MHYEEKVINGVLSFRTFHGAPFVPIPAEELTARIQVLENKVKMLENSGSLYEKAPWWANPSIPPVKASF